VRFSKTLQINAFYLQKEAEVTLRMETLLSKRRAAAMRGIPDRVRDTTESHVEWSAVEEGFRLLERDLEKLQVRVGTFIFQSIRDSDTIMIAICGNKRDRFPQDSEKI
jgi:hypothetical protein